jgi:hypothetical protein
MRLGRTLSAALLAATLLAGGAASSARAESEAPEDERLEALYGELAAPARHDVVRRLLQQPATRDVDGALRLVRALQTAGGVASVEGLLALAGHREPIVRAWALRGAAELGIRTSNGVEEARRALEAPHASLRRNACWALSVLGDARDVPVLLAIAADPDDEAAGYALDAVKALGDIKGPRFRTVVRVRAWWDANHARMLREGEEALAELEAGASPDLLEMHRAILCRAAWVQPDAVVERLKAWFLADDVRLRHEACRIVEAVRLGDLSDAIGNLVAYEMDDACLLAGARAARAIGVHMAEAVLLRVRRAEARAAARSTDAAAVADEATVAESATR